MTDSAHPNRGGLGLTLALSAIAGFVDGVGFVTLGGYFVAFMSGNSTRLAVAAASLSWREALFGLGLVALFVAGVAAGHLIGHRAPDRLRRLLFLEAALLLAGAWCFHVWLAAAAIPLMVLAMGVATATASRGGDSLRGIASMTGILARIGEDIAGAARGAPRVAGPGAIRPDSIWPWLALWLALIAGAAMGGALSLRWGGVVLGLPALALILLGWLASNKHDRPPVSAALHLRSSIRPGGETDA